MLRRSVCCTLAVGLLLCIVGCSPLIVMDGDNAIGRTAYTRINIYHLDQVHETTNYLKGTLLPVNSEVTILAANKKKIRYQDAQTGTVYVIVNEEKYTHEDIQGIFDRMFDSKKVPLDRFREEDRQGIEEGKPKIGMSKLGVLTAIGYPPVHKTPTLNSKAWRYWKGTFDTMLVYFDGDRVTDIRD